MESYIDWPGKSGTTYRYWFFELTGPIKAEGGNYMFVKQLPNGNLVPIYIGQADSLATRLTNHERLSDCRRVGATHAMAHTTPAGEQARLTEERDLIEHWQPPLNTRYKKVS